MSHDDWLTAAMSDSDIVAKLLVTLRSTTSPPPHRPPQNWTIHQRRSRTQTLIQPPNKSEPPRASPSTPLSWSGPTSDAAIDSSQQLILHNQSHTSRSKVTPPSETTSTKRPRKKKTLAALKEEEVLLITEQNDLKRKLAAMQSSCEKQRKRNESLKKMKLDLQVELQVERPKACKNNHFEAVNERNEGFVLPDLNVPIGEDVIMSY